MGRRKKICVVVTARPSYSRIRSGLYAIAQRSDLELQLVVAASALLDRFGNAVAAIKKDGFEISRKVAMVLEGDSAVAMPKSTGIGLIELASAFDDLQPDVVVTIADRYETIATAIAAAYMNIPLAHVQGGEVTGSIDEKVRHAVTKLADLHLVSTSGAAKRVLNMGEQQGSVIITGCPSIDIASDVYKNPALDFDPIEKYGGVGALPPINDGFVVVMQHPVTTESAEARQQVEATLHAVHDVGMPALWFWPNVDAGSDATSSGIRAFREAHSPHNIRFFKNMAPEDFLRLLCASKCLIGNSSVGIRECSFLGVPVVNIGSRQAGRERGANVVDVDSDRLQIRQAIKQQVDHGPFKSDPIYGDGRAGERIAQALAQWSPVYSKRIAY